MRSRFILILDRDKLDHVSNKWLRSIVVIRAFYILGAVSNSLFISWANSNGTSLIKQFMNHPGNTIMKVCKSTDWNVWTMFLCHQVVCVSKSKAVSSSSPQSSTVVPTCAGLPQTRGGVSQTLAVLQAGPRYQPSFPYKVWNVNV